MHSSAGANVVDMLDRECPGLCFELGYAVQANGRICSCNPCITHNIR